jgi:acyl-coenzyme A synthetase/AMP-(fatty) acid ligase
VIELLRRASARDTGAVAMVAEGGTWTYPALVAEAESLAHGLQRAGIERFAIVSNDIPLVVALLAASSLVGAEACVYAPDIAPEEMDRQAAAFAHPVVVSDRTDLGSPTVPVTRPESLRETDGPAPAVLPERRPLLVLTTGSTGTPKGVRHDWSRQLARMESARDGAGQVWLLAYGPNQFAGLQVLIHVLGSGATLVAPSVRRPQAVLELVHDHAVDHISATPTFWRFMLAEFRADARPVPRLKQITLGGEAAPGALLEELRATFPSARISHIYAGSEFGSTGSVRDGTDGLPASLLTESDGEVSLKIVDDELWVRSTASMLGYYGDADRPADEWWPTGDLVDVVDDRIVFRGRKTDVINVGGVKVHPLPVEDRVTAVPGVRIARVYGRANALVGAVVAVDVVADDGVDEKELKAAIRTACADLPRPWQPRSIQVVAELAMKENKVVRGGATEG